MRPSASLSLAVCGMSAFLLAAPSANAGPRLGRAERAIVRTIDRQRAAHGMHAVRPRLALSRAADAHSADMLSANYFAHTSSDGTSFATRLHRYVRSGQIGETLAYLSSCRGRRAAHRVVSMWMHSPPHRAILLTPAFHRIGVALRRGRLGSRRACVITADFAR